MIRGIVIDKSRTQIYLRETKESNADEVVAGKRKLGEKFDQSTIDKLAELDLDSDDEEELSISPDEEDDLLRSGIGHGRGRGRGRVESGTYNWKRSPAKFRQYRDVQSPMDDISSEVSAKENKEMLRKMFDDSAEAAAAPKDDCHCVEEEDDQLTELPLPFEKGTMCQMKWMRTVALDPSGKLQLKCSVSSNPGSETGKTESLMADTIKNLTNIYVKKRAEIVDSNGVVPTPVHAVKKMAMEHGESLHCEINKFQDGTHRVEMFSGSLRGLGEGETKKIAAQMACIDLLERIQLSGGSVKAPTVAFLPGWLTSNNIFRDLINLCKSKELPPVQFISKTNVDDNGCVDLNKPPHYAECWVGEELVTKGESECEVFAKREAARQMYQLISNVDYRETRYAIGQACRSVAELEGSGHRPIMSDYKKLWLLQHRVENKKLNVPEEEIGFDNQVDALELEKDVQNMPDAERLSYKLLKNKTIKVTVNNKNKRLAIDQGEDNEKSGSTSIVRRAISVEVNKDDEDSSELGDDDW